MALAVARALRPIRLRCRLTDSMRARGGDCDDRLVLTASSSPGVAAAASLAMASRRGTVGNSDPAVGLVLGHSLIGWKEDVLFYVLCDSNSNTSMRIYMCIILCV